MIENICDFRGKLNSLLQQLGNPGWGEVAAQIILKVIKSSNGFVSRVIFKKLRKLLYPPFKTFNFWIPQSPNE